MKTRFTVGHRAHIAGSEDDLGMPAQAWAPSVTKAVYGWATTTSEPSTIGHDRDVVEVELFVPPGFACDPADRIVLDSVEYDVLGAEHYSHSPFGWNPGGTITLRAVNG